MPKSFKFKWQYIPISVMILVLISWIALELTGVLKMEDIVSSITGLEKTVSAIVIASLLAIDIFLPVPATLLMPISGSMLGYFWGSITSIVGSMLVVVSGYMIGYFGGRKLAKKFAPKKELKEMEQWTKRHGAVPIILARTLPMMAETVSVSAGIAKTPFWKFMLYSFIGTAPICIVYVVAGVHAETFEEIFMIASAGFLFALIITIIVKKLIKKKLKEPQA